ncbi:MAG: dynamin family protein, partial [Rubrobacter sp.]
MSERGETVSESSTMIQQAREIRQETISILEKLARKSEEFELPKPPEALEEYHQRLAENTYKVLVVGEARRGKSSFVNALIGEGVLPTDVGVATSQVFDVRPAESEAYRLRFEDESVKEISLEDLPRYGSQVLEDAGERPELDQIIRWIEVDTPTIRFLPEGVSLLDTPGLGALYAAHAQITQRFVPLADAVIFVLDSEKQIVQSELEFLEEILKVTPDIFFIQTKIDLYSEDHWQDIRRRNKEILEERFGDRLIDTNVWPISSILLLAAAADGEDAEEDFEDSRHGELEKALQAFLFRVAGWRRSAEAAVVAGQYQA